MFFANEVLDRLLDRLNACRAIEEKEAVMAEFNRVMEKLPEEEKEKSTVGLSSELKCLGKFLTYSEIVGHYFKKTRGWFYHKPNGDLVNGKPAAFTPDELECLSEAFIDIAKQLGKTAGVLKKVAGQGKELGEKMIKG